MWFVVFKKIAERVSITVCLLVTCGAWVLSITPKKTDRKPRVLILTDISSLTPGVMEPDDGQSLVRLMLYTNELQVEGLIASSNLGHGQLTRADLIHQIIDAYGKVQPNLQKHDRAFPSPAQLHAVVRSGQPHAGPKVPVMTSIGPGRDTEGSQWIIRTVDQPDPRPVWICAWGGSADLAQALWKVRATRTARQLQTFLDKIRVHAIADQDMTGSWIREQFPSLFYILNSHNFRGIYRGGDTRLSDSTWVAERIQRKDNPLGMVYPNYYGGDIWSGRLGRVKGVKEGDTGSLLSLIHNGLNIPQHPELGGWGGIFNINTEGFYQDAVDSTTNYAQDQTPYMASIHRWRPDWQADFEARLDWCTKSFAEANHHPVANINGITSHEPIRITVSAGDELIFDAGKSSDPDKQPLRYIWQVYPRLTPDGVTLLGIDTPTLTCKIAEYTPVKMLPILLTVTDNGQPALRSYRRILLKIR